MLTLLILIGGALLLACPPIARAATARSSVRPDTIVTADSIVVEKGAHRLLLFHDGRMVRSYRVSLGPHPSGDKVRAGDGRTPEGVYTIDWRNPDSAYHLSLHISYPDARDRAQSRALGVSPGGDIMIHGLPNGAAALGTAYRDAYREEDWTEGCIAVGDSAIEELWRMVPVGTVIDIRP
ncbi:MAG TPA: L,D-transpeptidase family protein [Gemmatimonadaceae bacterium]|nr:L,D-transpeptidase family protein [Gemmatimonadaceae bacterium]